MPRGFGHDYDRAYRVRRGEYDRDIRQYSYRARWGGYGGNANMPDQYDIAYRNFRRRP